NLAGSLSDGAEKLSSELNHLILAGGFEQRVAPEDLLRFSEGAVGDRDLAACALVHSNAGGAEIHALCGDQPPLLHTFFDELAHRGHFGLRRGAVRRFVRENADEAHVCPPWPNFAFYNVLSNARGANRHHAESFFSWEKLNRT